MGLPNGYYEDLLRPLIAGRRWIVAIDTLIGAARTAEALEGLGAERCFCLAANRGTGPLPEDLEKLVLGLSGRSTMDGIRASEAGMRNLPADALARIDAFDPGGEARVIVPIWGGSEPIAGRRVFGARRPEWMALEDKTVVDDLWDAACVRRAPARVVPLEAHDLAEAARELDRGMGTVWVGDNRSGWHGGGEYLRWVRTPEDAESAHADLSEACDSARVMPFLDGIPCSIHGIVFPDYVAALRPCEMQVYRRPAGTGLRYGGGNTFWDPADADRDYMRALAKRVGAHIRETVGYRGVFTVDGVMTTDGFLPTELNPRVGGAIIVMTSAIERLPLYLLHLALVEGADLDWRPREFERLVVEGADRNRAGRVGTTVAKIVVEPAEQNLVFENGRFRLAAEGEPEDAQLMLGPSPGGSFLFVKLVAARTPVGESTGPRAIAALAYADERWDLGIGALEHAPDLRR